jgi:hypothetical protein
LKNFKSIFTILFTLSLTIFASSCIVQFEVKASEHLLFQDDFESYQVGDFPSEGGWEMIFSGAGSQYQVIVHGVSASPAKSLRLLGQSNWACDAIKRFNTDYPIIGYEAKLLVEDINVVDLPIGRVGFWSRAAPNIGRFYALVDFCGDGTIVAGGQDLKNYTVNTWYKIRVILDKETRLYSVWIDDVLLLEDQLLDIDPSNIEALGLASEMFGSYKAYFDDVKVFSFYEANPKLLLEPNSGIAATTLVGSGFLPNSKISVTWNGTSIHAVPNPLISDGYGHFTGIISVLNQTVSGSYIVRVIDEMGNEANATFEVVTINSNSILEDNSTINSDNLELESTNLDDVTTIEPTNFPDPELIPANVGDKPVQEAEMTSLTTLSSLVLVAFAVFALIVIYTQTTPTKPKIVG